MAKKYEIPEEEPQTLNPDEEFKEELLLSEASGFVSDEEFKRSCFEKWDVVL